MKLRNSGSIKELLQTCPFLKLYETDESKELKQFVALYCKLCYGKENTMRFGYFSYDCEKGTDFKGRDKTQPPEFYNLKSILIQHLLKNFVISKVVDRINDKSGKISF